MTPLIGNILEIDPIFLDHRDLIIGTGVCGIGDSYHDLALGTTIILSRDKPFTNEWHEGAHSFITQTSLLGFFMIFFTNVLFALTLQLGEASPHVRRFRKKLSSIKANLLVLRQELVKSFRVLHEIFALITERTGIIYTRTKKDGKTMPDSIEDLRELDKYQFFVGFEEHKKALDLCSIFLDKYGISAYCYSLVFWLLQFFLMTLVRIDPSELIYGGFDKFKQISVDLQNIVDSFISDIPAWAPDHAFCHYGDFMDEIEGRFERIRKHPCGANRKFSLDGWTDKFTSLLPLDDNIRRILHSLNNISFTIDHQFSILENLSKQIKRGKRDFLDQFLLLPTITLVRKDDHLRLVFRKDVSAPSVLEYTAFRHTFIPLTETMERNVVRKYILCFFGYAPGLASECKYEYTNCFTANGINKYSKCAEASHEFYRDKPIIICCKNNVASFLRISNSSNELIQTAYYPLEVVLK